MINNQQPRKELGQHWLRDTASLEAIVDAANVCKGDVVLEVGPGKGTLTDVLLAKGAKVLALEYDHQLFGELINKYANAKGRQIEVIEGDIRQFDYSHLPNGYKIVANIPYYLTANLLRKLVDNDNKPAAVSLLVQKEVAERVCAKPGQLSLIAVLVQVFYEVSLGEVVPAYLFEPAPKVESQVLVLRLREEQLVPDEHLYRLLQLLKAGFAQKRKKLKTSLAGGMNVSKSDISSWLKSAGLDGDRRAQELSIDDWYKLVTASQ